MPGMYDFVCDVCGEAREVLVNRIDDRKKPIPHKDEDETTDCLGMLRMDGIAAPHLWSGKTFLGDGRGKMQAIAYDGERKVGYVPGHFGKAATMKKK